MSCSMMYLTLVCLLPFLTNGRSTVTNQLGDNLVDDVLLRTDNSTSNSNSSSTILYDSFENVAGPDGDSDDDVLDEVLNLPEHSSEPSSDEYKVDVVRKAIQTKKVEGCYKSQTNNWMWSHTGQRYNFGSHNSNHKCQEKCRMAGKILAATRGTWCYCGNIFPKGLKVANSLCNTRCVSYTQCYGPQECCGGSNHYSLSVVGDIDVAREVLERLRGKWNSVAAYRNSVLNRVKGVFPARVNADWRKSFNDKGWSMCPKKDNNYLYMHGLWRSSGTEGLYLLEQADCRASYFGGSGQQNCYAANWWDSFNAKGWSTCKSGYFMTGLYRNGGGQELFRLEEARCCQPPAAKWGECIDFNVRTKFDNKGWTGCPKDYYMIGLWRNDCNELHCIEQFKCCKMASDPVFSIVVKDLKKKYTKKCSMTLDGSYKCDRVNEEPSLRLETKKFDVEDQSPLNVAQPRPIPGFKPKICSASNTAYTCSMSRSVATTKSSTFSIGTGFSMGYSQTVGASVGYEGFGASATASFESTISVTASFNAGYEKSTSKEITDTVQVSINVPKGTQVTIDVKRVKQDLIYFWKGHFDIIGRYSISYGGKVVTEDVTRILAGNDRKFYSFGKWEYPGTDFHKVIITDKYGVKKEKNCQLLQGNGGNCLMAL